MNIQSLCAHVYEDSEGLLKSQSTLADGALQLDFECDDWNAAKKRRRFQLRCEDVKEARIELGYVGAISLHEDHPLLLKHQGLQSELYFSTVPASPEVVFTRVSGALQRECKGWRESREFLNGTPDELVLNLRGGHGLLARGPKPSIVSLQHDLDALLSLQLLDSYVAKGKWLALIIETSWVISARVTVREHDA